MIFSEESGANGASREGHVTGSKPAEGDERAGDGRVEESLEK